MLFVVTAEKRGGVTRSKGLSQILYLIIAASVLMMVALSLIFMFNNSVGGSETSAQACQSSVKTQCQFSGASSIEPPSNCVTTAADGSKEIIDAMDDADGGDCGTNKHIDCADI